MGQGLFSGAGHAAAAGLVMLLAASASSARAQNVARDALPGGARLGRAEAPARFATSLTGEYGFTEDVLGDGASHHRIGGALAAAVAPISWLAAALRIDARYDTHGGDEDDDGATLDARLVARVRADATARVAFALQAGAWLVGAAGEGSAPELGAVEGMGLITLRPGPAALSLSAQAGFRFDRSGESVSARDQLAAGDRLALGVSDSNAVLMGLGAQIGGAAWAAFLEWTWDLLLGGAAPEALESPMHIVAGAAWRSGGPLTLTGFVDVTASQRPATGPGDALAPIDPRFTVGVALSATFGPPRSRSASQIRPPPPPPPPPPPASSRVTGRVVDDLGAPVAGARVSVTPESGAPVSGTTGADGGFDLELRARGAARLVVEAAGRPRVARDIRLSADTSAAVEVALEPALPLGQIRGLVRSLRGAALDARIVVEPGHMEAVTDRDGNFEVNVEPGEYEVTVSADGYTPQRRRVRVEERGVVLLNLDMRPGRRDRGQSPR
ncbi:MAG: carboxypeptidase regulatory-like domain-containing protein [Deltaproteobacteria bacterium]|nr:carboxypeptidase regulatory-like domain-containing protein [Deltaproteobacteria bacterium]